MDFQQRLEKAIERGHRASDAAAKAQQAQVLSEEELKRLHSQYRLELSDYIENCLTQLANHFPGFRLESIIGDRGWGAAVSRDDLAMDAGRRTSHFSRLELAIRPFSSLYVLELGSKGTIRNKEIFNRAHYERLSQVDVTTFKELVDLWVLEYAEVYAART